MSLVSNADKARAARLLWTAAEGRDQLDAAGAGKLVASVRALPPAERPEVWRLVDGFTETHRSRDDSDHYWFQINPLSRPNDEAATILEQASREDFAAIGGRIVIGERPFAGSGVTGAVVAEIGPPNFHDDPLIDELRRMGDQSVLPTARSGPDGRVRFNSTDGGETWVGAEPQENPPPVTNRPRDGKRAGPDAQVPTWKLGWTDSSGQHHQLTGSGTPTPADVASVASAQAASPALASRFIDPTPIAEPIPPERPFTVRLVGSDDPAKIRAAVLDAIRAAPVGLTTDDLPKALPDVGWAVTRVLPGLQLDGLIFSRGGAWFTQSHPGVSESSRLSPEAVRPRPSAHWLEGAEPVATEPRERVDWERPRERVRQRLRK